MYKYLTKGTAYSLVFGLALLGAGTANAATVPPWPSAQGTLVPTPDQMTYTPNSQNQVFNPGYVVPTPPPSGLNVPPLTPDQPTNPINSQNQLSNPGYIVPPLPGHGIIVPPLPMPGWSWTPPWPRLVPPMPLPGGGRWYLDPSLRYLTPQPGIDFGGGNLRYPDTW